MELADYADVLGAPVERLELLGGQRHDVVLDHAERVAWRFPRTTAALAAFPVSVARTRAAHAVGLPAPEVLALLDGPLGTARVGLRQLDGVGMSREVVDCLAPDARNVLVAGLAGLLGALSSVDQVAWPDAPTDPRPEGSGCSGGRAGAEPTARPVCSAQAWQQGWLDLGRRLRSEVLPLIGSEPGQLAAQADIVAAETTAGSVGAYGLTHADLGGANVLLEVSTGAITGVLDWDDAGPGDPAVDLAAVLAHAPQWLSEAILTADPAVAAMAQRAEAYIRTFALQQALWGVESGVEAEVTSGLAHYRAMGTSVPSADSASRTTVYARPAE